MCYLIKKFIYLAAWNLSCSMQNLLLQYTDSSRGAGAQ